MTSHEWHEFWADRCTLLNMYNFYHAVSQDVAIAVNYNDDVVSLWMAMIWENTCLLHAKYVLGSRVFNEEIEHTGTTDAS